MGCCFSKTGRVNHLRFIILKRAISSVVIEE
jgi:hypothetical protein